MSLYNKIKIAESTLAAMGRSLQCLPLLLAVLITNAPDVVLAAYAAGCLPETEKSCCAALGLQVIPVLHP